MRSRTWSYDLLWLSVALAFVIPLFFYLPIKANDYWMYLRMGRDTLATHSVPTVETITSSRAGQPIINLPWLAGVVLFIAHWIGGANGTRLLGALFLAVAYGLAWRLTRTHSGPRLATVLTYAVVLCTANNWAMRPQLLVYPLFVASLWAMHRWQVGLNRTLIVLPVCVLLWVNLHGSFVLPLLLAAPALLLGKGNRKLLSITIAAVLVATLANPYGIGSWRFLVDGVTSESVRLYSAEWRPPTFADWQDRIVLLWMAAFVPIAAVSRSRLSAYDWALFLGFGALALMSSRHIIWLMFVLVVQTAEVLAPWSSRWIDVPVRAISTRANVAFAAVTLVVCTLYVPIVRHWRPTEVPPSFDPGTTPIEAVKWLINSRLEGKIWNDFAFGSYLAFAVPDRAVWMDPRFHIYPPSQWREYLDVSAGINWQGVFEREEIDVAILSVGRQNGLILGVSGSPVWCERFGDRTAIILTKCEN